MFGVKEQALLFISTWDKFHLLKALLINYRLHYQELSEPGSCAPNMIQTRIQGRKQTQSMQKQDSTVIREDTTGWQQRLKKKHTVCPKRERESVSVSDLVCRPGPAAGRRCFCSWRGGWSSDKPSGSWSRPLDWRRRSRRRPTEQTAEREFKKTTLSAWSSAGNANAPSTYKCTTYLWGDLRPRTRRRFKTERALWVTSAGRQRGENKWIIQQSSV